MEWRRTKIHKNLEALEDLVLGTAGWMSLLPLCMLISTTGTVDYDHEPLNRELL
jgi:hypothetical protein